MTALPTCCGAVKEAAREQEKAARFYGAAFVCVGVLLFLSLQTRYVRFGCRLLYLMHWLGFFKWAIDQLAWGMSDVLVCRDVKHGKSPGLRGLLCIPFFFI